MVKKVNKMFYNNIYNTTYNFKYNSQYPLLTLIKVKHEKIMEETNG